MKIITTIEAAGRLGISTGRVCQLARARGLGRKIGNAWIFTERELVKLKPGPVGRPPSKSKARRRKG